MRLTRLLILAVAVVFYANTAFADTSASGPLDVKASIPAGLTLEATVIDQLINAVVPSLDFSELVRVGNEFRSKTFFKVYLRINSVGDPCTLSQNGTDLVRQSGAEIMPRGAYTVLPEYIEGDNSGQPQPPGSSLGVRGTVVGPRLLYTDPTGSDRVITSTYTLTGDPNTGATEVITLDQKSGNYSGTVQFTLTT